MRIRKNRELRWPVGTPREKKLRYDWKHLAENDDECNCEYCNIGENVGISGGPLLNAAFIDRQSDILMNENEQLVGLFRRQVWKCMNLRETCPSISDWANHIIEEALVTQVSLQNVGLKMKIINDLWKIVSQAWLDVILVLFHEILQKLGMRLKRDLHSSTRVPDLAIGFRML